MHKNATVGRRQHWCRACSRYAGAENTFFEGFIGLKVLLVERKQLLK